MKVHVTTHYSALSTRHFEERGVTLLELMVTVTILLVLASVAMPLSKYTSKRTQELELRQKLREMRNALDEFRRDWARDGEILAGQLCVKNKTTCKEVTGVTGYPKSLETLLEVKLSGAEATVKETTPIRRYLRRVPLDPMTGTDDWGLRCYLTLRTSRTGARRTCSTFTPRARTKRWTTRS